MSEDIRFLPAPNDGGGRVETGVVVFGEDWPGVFIRGDNCIGYAIYLREAARDSASPIAKMAALGLSDLLMSCQVGAYTKERE